MNLMTMPGADPRRVVESLEKELELARMSLRNTTTEFRETARGQVEILQQLLADARAQARSSQQIASATGAPHDQFAAWIDRRSVSPPVPALPQLAMPRIPSFSTLLMDALGE